MHARKLSLASLLSGVALNIVAPASAAAMSPDDQPPAGTTTTGDAEETGSTTQPTGEQIPAGEADDNVIVVTGIRASLGNALDLKRETIGVVDAISAEDIGNFPDANIAESLQRITGVAVDRVNGEGSGVTVRGLGPEFNTVLLNNRLLSTTGGGRSFSFNILPSELISGAEVYKSSEARLQEGGIGSTIILRTARPTDRAGFHFAGSIAGQHDSTADKITPFASGFISQSNDDQTFGILASFVYDKRISTLSNISTDGWIINQNIDSDGDGVNDTASGPGTGVALPRTLNFTSTHNDRERIGGTFALDYAPSDTLRLELDALYTQQKTSSVTNQLGYYVDPGRITSATINQNNTATQFTVLPATPTAGLASDNILATNPEDARTYQIAANAQWNPADDLEIVFDAAHSNTRSGADQLFYVVGTRQIGVTPTFVLDGPDGLPTMTNVLAPNDKSAPRLHCCSERGGRNSDTINQGTIDATWDLSGFLDRIQGGLLFTNRKKTTISRESPEPLGCFYCGYQAVAPSNLFSDFSANVLGRDLTWLTYDRDALVQFYGSAAAVNQVGGNSPEAIAARERFLAVYQGNNNSLDPIDRDRGSGTVRENTFAAYLQGSAEGTLGQMPYTLLAGGRLVHTDVHVTGYSVTLLDVIQNPADPTAAVPVYSPTIPVDADNKYTYLLPSLNFRLNLTDDLVFRLAGSRTLTRPTLSRLGLSQSFVFRPPNSNTVSGGNPNLKPFLAWNADAAIDYYLSRTSYVSLTGFYKKLQNFIISGQQFENYFGLTFTANRPYNAQDGEVYGLEAAVQTTFDFLPAPFNNMGVTANYTKVESSIRFDPSLSNQTFNVEGLSDTANLILFYEDDTFQIRGAYNWRAPFLRQTFGPQSQPENIFGYDQIDLSGSIKFNDRVSLFAEVLNLTNEDFRSYSRYEERLITVSDQGRRITVGLRANF
ncbi:TonB-dependent receptor [Erythrobacter sp. LQ02-29]|uniref:TonB-dependent receptor n=1 Tax=Erythrobacter sp. LQ02-29 TaxID=2920384 RepID=UPI001F4E1882|nr:TonB-dependent receptor [Erythrobacter sp. LQ02-29]MCP9223640.1 TonB-dependent receptor [Erythrobacter sp. LQ02-29]